MRIISFLVAAFAANLAVAQGVSDSPERWQIHLTEDLLPFWDDPAAIGTPIGSFAGNLCNDGTAPLSGTSCTGVSSFRASHPQQTLVSQSRQVFSYAVAFHMTGQQAYLDLAQAGLEYQFDTFLDADTGLFHEVLDISTGTLSSQFNSQKQAYGLLGASFVHYLTGDADLYARIAPIQQTIQTSYRDPSVGSYRPSLTQALPADTIAHHLDQLNTYQTLLASQAPLADRSTLQADALQTAQYLRDAFYDPTTNLMKPTLTTEDGSLANADYGHSIKSFWFIDQTAKLAGDTELSRFAQNAAKALFETAYREDMGAWHTNLDDSGIPSDQSHWWGFAELNQYAASLAIEDPSLRETLAATQSYWLENFVDGENGGIWDSVNTASGEADTEAAKHRQWKSGFHSFEHVLINYLSASAIEDGTADLFFARSDLSELELAYGFSGDLSFEDLDPFADNAVQQVTVSNLTYATALAPVPLPAPLWLLAGSCLLLARRAKQPKR
ncbi:MAG: AGE family epimerase/isomerase [Aliishimia sp.]